MNRLSYATLPTLPEDIQRPRRAAPPALGIVHFGPGAFHRAHQASYIDTLLDHDPRWGIAAVALRSSTVVAALAAQQGLYTIAVRDAESSNRIVGAHGAWLGPRQHDAISPLLADPAIGLVTMTVTEKGYCLAADGTLDPTHPDIVHDLTAAESPRSVIGWIVDGLAARRARGVEPFVAMPCDNLAANGRKLHDALVAFAAARDAGLAAWIREEVRVPSTMVDSITPATQPDLLSDLRQAYGQLDTIPVQREAFLQWVVEDVGPHAGPDLAAAGVIVTADLGGYERAKLRILNGAHSTLAYAGLLRGHASVAKAMADDALAAFVDALVCDDVIPMVPRVAGLDLDTYRQAVFARFRNPAIKHRLEQIAQDGTQKLPYRLADTITANRQAGRMPLQAIAAMGCWVAFVLGRSREGVRIVDPQADVLAAAAAGADVTQFVQRLIDAGLGLAPLWRDDPALITAMTRAAQAAHDGNWDGVFVRNCQSNQH